MNKSKEIEGTDSEKEKREQVIEEEKGPSIKDK